MAAGEEERSMAKPYMAGETTVIPILREDGTVYFQYGSKTAAERLCEWTLASLWLLVVAVTVGTLIWA
jgi:hypothetical protein